MKKHRKEITPITYETTLENARRWLNIIRYGESGTIIQLQDDCEFRILEIFKNHKILKSILGPYYRKYLLTFISLDERDLLKTIKDSLINLSIEKKIGTRGTLTKLTNSELLSEIANSGYDVGLFIIHFVPLLKKQNFQQLFDLEILIRTSKNLSVIVFSELDITHEKYDLLVDKAAFLYDHIIKYPLYSDTDSFQFISHYNQQWQFSLPQKTISEILHACGGYLWLIHQVLRNLRDNPTMSVTESVSHELTVRKLEAIWSKFTDEEKKIIRKVFYRTIQKIDTFSHVYEYLRTIRVLKEKEKKIELGIPILSLVIEKENRLSELQIRDERIFIGEREITSVLTRKERSFMHLLLLSKKKIVARDNIAQVIWGKNADMKYSDWAIDRLAYRLRKKLKSLSIDEKLLNTVKKKGFIFG